MQNLGLINAAGNATGDASNAPPMAAIARPALRIFLNSFGVGAFARFRMFIVFDF